MSRFDDLHDPDGITGINRQGLSVNKSVTHSGIKSLIVPGQSLDTTIDCEVADLRKNTTPILFGLRTPVLGTRPVT
jgi:hypothetical protein